MNCIDPRRWSSFSLARDSTRRILYTQNVDYSHRLGLNNRVFAGTLIALAMMMKLLIPSGFMPAFDHGRVIISICTGTGPMKMVMTIPGAKHDVPDQDDHHKSEHPCPFSSLAAHSLAATDPVLLALAILFAMALMMFPMAPPLLRGSAHLRPPLRGPPVRL